jgi:hypothetical protein
MRFDEEQFIYIYTTDNRALEVGLSFEEIQTIFSEQLVNHIQKS